MMAGAVNEALEADAVVAAWEAKLPASVPQLQAIQNLPTPDRPFVYYHLRKAGGSSLRRALSAAASRLRVASYLPCLGGVPCEKYAPPIERVDQQGARRYAILGGHFNKADVSRWHQMFNEANVSRWHQISSGGGSQRRPGCLVMLRRTVERVTSCWNFRFVQEAREHGFEDVHNMADPIQDTRLDELNATLASRRSSYGEGCNNENLRVLSAIGRDESIVSELTSSTSGWSRFAIPALDDALGQLSQCVVVALERCEETMLVLRHFLPWLVSSYDCKSASVEGRNAGRVPRGRLSDGAKQIIEDQNALDTRVYAFGLKQLEMQLRLINGQSLEESPAAILPLNVPLSSGGTTSHRISHLDEPPQQLDEQCGEQCDAALEGSHTSAAVRPGQVAVSVGAVRCVSSSCFGIQAVGEAAVGGAAVGEAAVGGAAMGGAAAALETVHMESTPSSAAVAAAPLGDSRAGRCRVLGNESTRVAVAFFGRFRNLSSTLTGLQANLLSPLEDAASGAVDVFVHHLVTHESEASAAAPLRSCSELVEDQERVDVDEGLVAKAKRALSVATWPASEHYSLPTMMNLFRSRFSVHRAARLVLEHQERLGIAYTHVVVARPDALFLTLLPWRPLRRGIQVPNQFHWWGVNDHFALGDSHSMLHSYMQQYPEQLAGEGPGVLINSESLLCEQLASHRVALGVLPLCVIRASVEGQPKDCEDFIRPVGGPYSCVLRENLRHVPSELVSGRRGERADHLKACAGLGAAWGCPIRNGTQ